jgi:hypothetical protein
MCAYNGGSKCSGEQGELEPSPPFQISRSLFLSTRIALSFSVDEKRHSVFATQIDVAFQRRKLLIFALSLYSYGQPTDPTHRSIGMFAEKVQLFNDVSFFGEAPVGLETQSRGS